MSQAEPVAVGVDVGATKVLVGCVGRDGLVRASRRYPMNRESQAATLDSIHSAVEDFLGLVPCRLQPVGIGVGLVGLTDPATGTWLHSMNLSIRVPVPLAARLHDRHGLPVAVDNDVHAATLAELRLGAGRRARDFVYVGVGTGVAAGLVCNGQLVRGSSNYAGELGHTVVEPEGDPCQCGRRGCLEPIASGGGMIAHVEARLADYPASPLWEPARRGELTSAVIFRACDAGDALATSVTNRAVRALGIALTNLVNLLNPELIVLGGGVVADGWLIPRLRDYVAANALRNAYRGLRGVEPSELSADLVGLLGAAALAWERPT